MNKLRNKRGITLVALVITIIILLILAGVSIAQLTSSGLFERARQASEESKYANAEEKVKLAVMASYDGTGEINDELLKNNLNKIEGIQEKVEEVVYTLTVVVDGYEFEITELGIVVGKNKIDKLPEDDTENDPSTDDNGKIEIGDEVDLKDGWGSQTVKYIKTSDGTEVKEIETVSTVYAVSLGNEETVPVPNGFYYVGGNFNSGVVISDNEADKNKYAGQEVVGIDLQGNQFVWIPCEASNYKKTSWGQGTVTNRSDSYWDTTVDTAGLIQTEKYGGYYVARYESGLDISKAHTSATAWDSTLYDSETAKVQSKAGLIPWNWVSWNTSKARAEEMYNTNYVRSGLITGAQWDVMINTINTKTGASLTDSKWGNYDNTSITYAGAGATYSESAGTLGVFTGTGGTTNSSTGTKTLLYTGASTQCMKYNLYDVAGNVWEWTEETSYYGGNVATEYRVLRGGSSTLVSSSNPVCYRKGNGTVTNTGHGVGFRVVLYMK